MRIDLPEQKKLVHQITIPIRWGDMDAMGHVNNTLYFRYMEIARIDWMRGLGFQSGERGQGIVIVNAFCNFLRQFTYPADVLVKTYVSAPGRSSFDTWATMEKAGASGPPYATGGATVVWMDYRQQQSAPLPEQLRRIIAEPG